MFLNPFSLNTQAILATPGDEVRDEGKGYDLISSIVNSLFCDSDCMVAGIRKTSINKDSLRKFFR
jgi:hypothetical protein